MSLTRQLLEREEDAEAPVATVEETSSVGSEAAEAIDHAPSAEPKTAAAQDAKATAEAATKFAGLIRSELEKTASEGGHGESGELAKTLLKAAHYITELLEVNASKQKYADGLLKEAADLQTYREAVKLAGELMAAGQLEVPEDYNLDDVAVNLMKDDLRVVKRASQFANAGKLGNLGQAAPDKSIKSYDGLTDDGGRRAADDKSFLDAHSFLLDR